MNDLHLTADPANFATINNTLASFVRALRTAGVRISTAETLDAFRAVAVVSLDDRSLVKDSLAAALPKTVAEKDIFNVVFDRFFQFDEMQAPSDPALADADFGSSSATDNLAESGTDDGESQGGTAFTDALSDSGGTLPEARSALGQLLMTNDQAALSQSLAVAAQAVQIDRIQVFTQKGLYARRIMDAMGQADLLDEIHQLQQSGADQDQMLATALQNRRAHLREEIRNYTERQFLTHADATGRQVQEQLLKKVKLSNLDRRTFNQVQKIVMRMARKLITQHAKRRTLSSVQSRLNVAATIRKNAGFDGNLFDLRWHSKKLERSSVFVLCDVSGSVANYSRFMLTFLYAMEQIIPKLRAFAFAGNLSEITELLQASDLPEAIDQVLSDYAFGATDYGQSLEDFCRLCLQDVSHRSVLIILGDSRNNYGNPRTELLRKLYHRARRVIWLNPESRYSWNTGDALMRSYGAFCHQTEVCNSLMHLERIVSRLLSTLV